MQSTPNVSTENMFELLADAVEDHGQRPPVSKKIRLPPIYCYGQSTKQIIQRMNMHNITQESYQLRLLQGMIRVSTTNKTVFDSVVDIFKQDNVQFYSHDTASDSPMKVVLSGLPVYSLEELKQEMVENNIDPLNVKVLSVTESDIEKHALYLVYFSKGSIKLQDLSKVKTLFSTQVSWRPYTRKPQDAVQCHRCQAFGHGMKYCNLPPQCVKCGKKHSTSACNLPKKAALLSDPAVTQRNNVKCANCGGNHTANFKGCPSRADYLKKQQELKQRLQAKNQQLRHPRRAAPTLIDFPPLSDDPPRPTRTSSQSISYADVVNAEPSRVLRPQDTEPDLFSVAEFMCLARDLFSKLSKCKTKLEQFLAVGELLLTYVYNG